MTPKLLDLSACKPGQRLLSKRGVILTYVGPNPVRMTKFHHLVRYPNGSQGTRTNDGFTYSNTSARLPDDHDIVAIFPLEAA
jgi:hypothetical protein